MLFTTASSSLTLFLSDRGFSFLSAGVVALSPEEPAAAAALAVDPAALALAEEEAVAVFPSTLDCTYTHREHNAHARRGREERYSSSQSYTPNG